MDVQQFLTEFGHIANAPKGVVQLRQMIYQLAVTGSLTPRDDKSTTASHLLFSIEQERQRLIHAKKYKRMLELESESVRPPKGIILPASWRWSRLLDVGEINPRNSASDDLLAAFVPMSGVSLSHRAPIVAETRRWGQIKKGYTHFANGDVVLAKITPCFENGKGAVIEKLPGDAGIGAGTTELLVFRPIHAGVLPAYIYLFLRSPLFMVEGERSMTGTAGQKRIPTDYFATRAFPLPPTEEQARIVVKVDELMALCDQVEAQQQERRNLQNTLRQANLQVLASSQSSNDLQENWQRLQLNFAHLFSVPKDVEDFRLLTMNLAVRGRLTEQRDEDEPSTFLLERIANEQQQLVLDRRMKRPKPLPEIDTTDFPFGLPKGWSWARFPELGIFGRGKSRHRPRNDPRLFSPGIYPLVQTGEVARSRGLIREYHSKYSEVGLEQSKLWPKGTLCITIAANIADVAILGFDACFPDSVVGFIPSAEIRDEVEYFLIFMQTARNRLLEFAPSTAQKNINLEILNSVLIPVPPVSEIKRILEKVRGINLLCDRLKSDRLKALELGRDLSVAAVATLTGITTEQEEKTSVKAPQTELLAPLRLGVPPDAKVQAPLATLLARHNGEMSARDLWQRFGGEIDAFYAQLKIEVAHGWVDDPTYELDAKAPDSPKKYPDGAQVAKMKITEEA